MQRNACVSVCVENKFPLVLTFCIKCCLVNIEHLSLDLCLCVCLSLSIYLYIYLAIFVSDYIYLILYIYPSTYQSNSSFICIHLSIYLSAHPSIHPPPFVFTCQFFNIKILPSFHSWPQTYMHTRGTHALFGPSS